MSFSSFSSLRSNLAMLALFVVGGLVATQRTCAQQQVVLLRGVRLIDGTGAPPREPVSLLLREGRIEKVGETMAVPPGAQVRELSGKTVMPGLISAHSHLGLIVDDAESSATGYTRENVSAQLKQFERYGVTTIMSLGANRDLVYELKKEQKEGKLGGGDDLYRGARDWRAGRCSGTVSRGRPNLSAGYCG
jgi:hypothetical protein